MNGRTSTWLHLQFVLQAQTVLNYSLTQADPKVSSQGTRSHGALLHRLSLGSHFSALCFLPCFQPFNESLPRGLQKGPDLL